MIDDIYMSNDYTKERLIELDINRYMDAILYTGVTIVICVLHLTFQMNSDVIVKIILSSLFLFMISECLKGWLCFQLNESDHLTYIFKVMLPPLMNIISSNMVLHYTMHILCVQSYNITYKILHMVFYLILHFVANKLYKLMLDSCYNRIAGHYKVE